MKYFIGILLVLAAVAFLKQPHKMTETKAITENPPQTLSITDKPKTETKSSVEQTKLEQITNELGQLNQKLEEIDQELEKVGYPKIMLDENLPEAQRNHIIDKLNSMGTLISRISMLNMKKIDLEVRL